MIGEASGSAARGRAPIRITHHESTRKKGATRRLRVSRGLRGVNDFPVPGQGNIDHEAMFRTLFAAGFNGPMAIERDDGTDGGMNKVPTLVVIERLTAAYQYLAPVLDKVTANL